VITSQLNESGIYLHLGSDGKPHCSYDLDFGEVEQLEPPEDTMFSTLEYVENQLYMEDGLDHLLNQVATEEIRAVGAEPPQVGTLYYQDGEIDELDFDLPTDFSEW